MPKFGLLDGQPLTEEYLHLLSELGIGIMRCSGRLGATWEEIEVSPGQYNWEKLDLQVSLLAGANIRQLINIQGQRGAAHPVFKFKPAIFPKDRAGYAMFVQKLVERYDGDGKDDAPGSPRVDYWQIENEVDWAYWGGTPEEYAELLTVVAPAIRTANPKAKIVMAGASGDKEAPEYYKKVLKALRDLIKEGNCPFDLFDFHVFGAAGGDYQEIGRMAVLYRDMLAHYGFTNIPLIVTETCTYSGSLKGRDAPEQSEDEQAADLVKRYVCGFANDVTSIFWVSLNEWKNFGGDDGGYFDHVGLVNNPVHNGRVGPKRAYYTMKRLTRILGDAEFMDTVPNLPPGFYGAFFRGPWKEPIAILWSDLPAEEPQLVLIPWQYSSGQVSPLVTDKPNAEEGWIYPVEGNMLGVRVGRMPILVTQPSALKGRY